jgi:cell division septal protein FtsQ
VPVCVARDGEALKFVDGQGEVIDEAPEEALDSFPLVAGRRRTEAEMERERYRDLFADLTHLAGSDPVASSPGGRHFRIDPVTGITASYPERNMEVRYGTGRMKVKSETLVNLILGFDGSVSGFEYVDLNYPERAVVKLSPAREKTVK